MENETNTKTEVTPTPAEVTTSPRWIIAAIILFVAPFVWANNYEGARYATTEGKVYYHLSGQFSLAASSTTASTYTVTLNGAGVGNNGLIAVSTSSTVSGETMCLAGAHAALPTTGYKRGCILYLTTDPTKIYIATETVVGTQSWLGK